MSRREAALGDDAITALASSLAKHFKTQRRAETVSSV